MKTLAQFIQEKRENLGFSAAGLAKRCSLPLKTVEDIEAGKELFLSVTVRQSLARVLRCAPADIKVYEKDFIYPAPPAQEVIDSLKDLILNGAEGLVCPVCSAPLLTRVARMYDLEDNLVLDPKAHCSKCTFQIKG